MESTLQIPRGPKVRPVVRVFASWASVDGPVAQSFWALLGEALAIDATYDFDVWSFDRALCVGERWDEEIRDALGRAHLGILALTPAFLNSRYIQDVELPAFVGGEAAPGRWVVPVLLKPLPTTANLRGLAAHQIFRHPRLGDSRAFSRAGAAKDLWVHALVEEIHEVLCRYPSIVG